MAMPARMWQIPEGLKVRPDGSWRVGDLQVIHPPTLRYLKSHLVLRGPAARSWWTGRSACRSRSNGPPFEVVSLVVDGARGAARVVLDDGTEETVREDSLGMDRADGPLPLPGARRARAGRVVADRAPDPARPRRTGGRAVLPAGRRASPPRARVGAAPVYIGAHVPVTGGLFNAPRNGVAVGAEAIQIFTRNQMQWRCRPLEDAECGAFREALAQSGVRVALSHGSYLVNLASPVRRLPHPQPRMLPGRDGAVPRPRASRTWSSIPAPTWAAARPPAWPRWRRAWTGCWSARRGSP